MIDFGAAREYPEEFVSEYILMVRTTKRPPLGFMNIEQHLPIFHTHVTTISTCKIYFAGGDAARASFGGAT